MKKRSLVIISLFVIIVFLGSFSEVFASSGSVYESESNNSYESADITYDDYDSYGRISSSADVDWWKITIATGGFANFWLGNIPNGCNYDIRIYKETSSGLSYVVKSTKTSNSSELCRIHVRSGEKYYVKISSISGSSSSYYLFRVKRYNLKDARAFTTTVEINTRPCGYILADYVSMIGYTGQEYLNNTAFNFYSSLPLADIIVEVNKGVAGGAKFYDSTLYANSFTGMSSQDRALSTLSYNALEDTRLIIYLCSYSGLTHPTCGNLVDKSLNKGAFCCIGLNEVLWNNMASSWFYYFMERTRLGYNVQQSLEYANNAIINDYPDYYEYMTDQYIGTSSLSALKFG